MQAVAEDLSGYAGKFRRLFQSRVSNSLFDSFIFKGCSLTDTQRLSKSFLPSMSDSTELAEVSSIRLWREFCGLGIDPFASIR